MADSITFAKSENIVTRKIDEELILVPISYDVADMQFLFTFNELGSFIWDSLDGKNNVSDISALIIKAFDVSEKDALNDTKEFLREMYENNLIELKA